MIALELHMFGGNCSLQSTMCFVEHPRSRDGDMAMDGIPSVQVDRSALFLGPPLTHPSVEG